MLLFPSAGFTIHHATKPEETMKKWLSMMTRDCNCFYKIMVSASFKINIPNYFWTTRNNNLFHGKIHKSYYILVFFVHNYMNMMFLQIKSLLYLSSILITVFFAVQIDLWMVKSVNQIPFRFEPNQVTIWLSKHFNINQDKC